MRISKEEELSICELYLQTNSEKKVAEITKHSTTTISKYLIRNGLGRGRGGNQDKQRKITDEQLIEACKTMTRQEIADVYGMNVVTIDKRMSKLGIHAVYTIRETTSQPRYQRTWEEYNAERKAKAEERRKQKAKLKSLWDLLQIIEEKVDKKCEICGEIFHSKYQTQKRCTDCQRYFKNRRKDKRIPKDRIIDRDITLKKLFKRDGGKCWICGGDCNWNDTFINNLSNKRYGPTYPSKDHVIPIARGGFESWDNVRLAHLKCNEEKSANIYPYLPMSKEFAYSYKGHGTPPKRTAQYTLDGRLVKIWPSTASIRRELGLDDKHIQNVCRKRKSNTGNAYGYHWEYVDFEKEAAL